MKLILALGVGSPLGIALREVATGRWWEWLARVYYSSTFKQYKTAGRKRPEVQALIDEVEVAEWVCIDEILDELHRRGMMRKVSREDFFLTVRIAQIVWADALWGYSIGGWSMSGTEAAGFVQRTYGITWGTVDSQAPREYLLLEQWLGQLAAELLTVLKKQ